MALFHLPNDDWYNTLLYLIKTCKSVECLKLRRYLNTILYINLEYIKNKIIEQKK